MRHSHRKMSCKLSNEGASEHNEEIDRRHWDTQKHTIKGNKITAKAVAATAIIRAYKIVVTTMWMATVERSDFSRLCMDPKEFYNFFY